MLVVSRKVGEEVAVGDTGRIVVLAVRGNSVVIGLDFPREVAIYRMELLGRTEPEQGSDSNGK